MRVLLPLVLLVSSHVQLVEGFGSGAPQSQCTFMTPSHGGTAEQTSAFTYTLSGMPAVYNTGEMITLTLGGGGGGFKGYMIQARTVAGDAVGQMIPVTGSQTVPCGNSGNEALTHNSNTMKTTLTFTWEAPDTSNGILTFYATIVEDYSTFWIARNIASVSPNTGTASTSIPMSQTSFVSPQLTTQLTTQTTTLIPQVITNHLTSSVEPIPTTKPSNRHFNSRNRWRDSVSSTITPFYSQNNHMFNSDSGWFDGYNNYSNNLEDSYNNMTDFITPVLNNSFDSVSHPLPSLSNSARLTSKYPPYFETTESHSSQSLSYHQQGPVQHNQNIPFQNDYSNSPSFYENHIRHSFENVTEMTTSTEQLSTVPPSSTLPFYSNNMESNSKIMTYGEGNTESNIGNTGAFLRENRRDYYNIITSSMLPVTTQRTTGFRSNGAYTTSDYHRQPMLEAATVSDARFSDSNHNIQESMRHSINLLDNVTYPSIDNVSLTTERSMSSVSPTSQNVKDVPMDISSAKISTIMTTLVTSTVSPNTNTTHISDVTGVQSTVTSSQGAVDQNKTTKTEYIAPGKNINIQETRASKPIKLNRHKIVPPKTNIRIQKDLEIRPWGLIRRFSKGPSVLISTKVTSSKAPLPITTTTTTEKEVITPPRGTTRKMSVKGSDIKYDDDCGSSKGCFVECQGQNCDFLVTWRDVGASVRFEVYGKPGFQDAWVAVGFSSDTKMGDDSVTECIANNGVVQVFNSENVGYSNRKLTPPQAGLSNFYGVYSNGILYCSFDRQKFVPNLRGLFDLEQDWNIMFASGRADTFPAWVMIKHNNLPPVSAGRVDFQSFDIIGNGAKYTIVKAHGCLMILSWVLFTGIGIVAARYYKNVWTDKTFLKLKIWFQIHRACMVAAVVLNVIAFIIIFVDVGGYSQIDVPGKAYLSSHPVLGIIVTALCLTNPIMALVRPAPDDSKRAIFNWAHWGVGMTAYILSAICICFGFQLAKSSTPDYAIYIMIVYIIHIIIFDVIYELLDCMFKKQKKGKVESVEMSNQNGQTDNPTPNGHYQTKEGRKSEDRIKTVLLAVHVAFTGAFALVLILVVALN